MYCDFFGLRCRPFEDRADTQFFFPRADCEEALAAMDYEAHHGKGMSLVLGEAGTGKTLLIRVLLQRLHASDQAVVLPWPSTGRMELLREAAKGFGVSLPTAGQPSRYLSRLRRHLIRTREAQRRSILIIDQAENLAAANIAELEALADLMHGGGRLLNITLVGQPHLRSMLARREFARISQQLFGERFLAPLTREETEEYVPYRLRAAGAGNVDLFERAAIDLIHTASKGIPRLVNHMCNAGMLAAYGARESQVSAAIAAEVTSAKGTLERSVDAREVGVATAEQVAAGLPSLSRQTDGREVAVSRGSSPAVLAAAVASGGGRVATSPKSDVGPDSAKYDPYCEPEHATPGKQTPDEEPEFGSVGWDSLDDAADSTLREGERLLHRLEWVLGRADRVGATTEASLAQFTAVEKHLTALTGSADRQMAKLAEAVQRATGSLDTVERRVDEILGRTEGRMQAIAAEITRANETSTDTEDQTHRLQRASEQAAEAESRLKSFAGQLADKVDEVQERVASLMKSMEGADEVRKKLDDAIERAPFVMSEAEEKAADLRDKLQQRVEKGERLQEQSIQVVLDANRRKVEEQIRDFERSSRSTIESAQRELGGILEQANAATAEAEEKAMQLTSALQRTVSEAERIQVQFMETSPHQLREKLQEQVELCEAIGAQAVETAADKLGQTARQLTKLTEDAGHETDSLRTTLSETKAEADRIRSELVDSAVRKLQERLQERLDVQLRNQEEEAESLIAAHQAKLEASVAARVQALAESAASGQLEIEKKLAAWEQACRQRIASSEQAHEESLASLAARTDQLGQDMDALERRRHEVQLSLEPISDGLVATTETAGALNQRLQKAEVTVQELAERSDAAVKKLSHEIERGERLMPEAAAACGQVEATQRSVSATLMEIGGAAERVHALREEASQCRELAGRLTSKQADGEKTVQRLDELVRSARQAHDAVQGVVAHLDEKVGRLDSHHAAATSTLRSLSEAVKTGHHTIERITESARTAAEAADERTDNLSQVLALATTLTNRAESGARGIASTIDEAGELMEQFGEAFPNAESLVVVLGDLIREADTATGRLTAQAAATQKSIEAGEPIIREFISQVRALEQRIQELHGKTSQCETALGEATSKPAEAIAAAQAQAAQLERVCGAVRKVFSGLSQATLDARTHTRQCTDANEQASERLAALSAQTDHAAATLHEWVEEASRAQARLERTLRRCPTIHETHPGDALRRVSHEVSAPISRIANPSVGGEVSTLQKPPVTEPPPSDSPEEESVPEPPAREQEVSSLIQDARRTGVRSESEE